MKHVPVAQYDCIMSSYLTLYTWRWMRAKLPYTVAETKFDILVLKYDIQTTMLDIDIFTECLVL